ncbi:hypothetical protein BCU70_05100 [Vibrio sp. 10N.286.49.C2]|uniref:ROK family protein n=1 Tax=unclassified Vibrio TaxID=2614977 RepID=UPI000C8244E2|nr:MULTISPECIES: ROK family protein [unclassified Vibrio]PMH33858.1 hypothetical protein BCU70_05100 [Vibrio sp. 10N.286.49.C2]PMH44116.1 hypothetical protein BCU66_04010 [Vibrio sp. 10N.286.49.B1]PMH80935.1 hypothetical protein BCU58_22455 [Vibrio sp. 10N.286.48.B7]
MIGSVAIKEGTPELGSHLQAGEITLLVDKAQRPSTRKLQVLLSEQKIHWNGYDELAPDLISSRVVSDWCQASAVSLSRLIEMIIAINDPSKIVIGGGLNLKLVETIVDNIALKNGTRKEKIAFATPVLTAEAERGSPAFGAAYLPLLEVMYQ